MTVGKTKSEVTSLQVTAFLCGSLQQQQPGPSDPEVLLYWILWMTPITGLSLPVRRWCRRTTRSLEGCTGRVFLWFLSPVKSKPFCCESKRMKFEVTWQGRPVVALFHSLQSENESMICCSWLCCCCCWSWADYIWRVFFRLGRTGRGSEWVFCFLDKRSRVLLCTLISTFSTCFHLILSTLYRNWWNLLNLMWIFLLTWTDSRTDPRSVPSWLSHVVTNAISPLLSRLCLAWLPYMLTPQCLLFSSPVCFKQ